MFFMFLESVCNDREQTTGGAQVSMQIPSSHIIRVYWDEIKSHSQPSVRARLILAFLLTKELAMATERADKWNLFC